MDTLASLGRTLGFSLGAGINLYATVAILGLAQRYGWVTLPPQFHVFDHDLVIAVALVLYAIEFVADKDDRVFFDPARKIGPQVAAALLERGVIGRAMPQGDILGFAPPLCLTRGEADIIVDRTADAVKSVFADL